MRGAMQSGGAAALPLALLAQAIPMLTRHELEAVTERLIDRLDQINADPDLEDDDPDQCVAGDDGCAPVRMNGRIYWGGDEY